MARGRKPKVKMQRRFGMMAEGASKRKPRKMSRKKSDYGVRLEEKQKLKFFYGVLEKQLRRYVREAFRTKGDPGEEILRILETRLDNVVFRLGYAKTREQARQLVSHGHVLINGRKMDIPSYEVRPGDKIMLKEKMLKNHSVQELLKNIKPESLPSWLKREENRGKLERLPLKDELPQDVNVSLIVEFYS